MITHRYSRPLALGVVLVLLLITFLSFRPEPLPQRPLSTHLTNGECETIKIPPLSNGTDASNNANNDLNPPIYDDTPVRLSKVGKVTVAANVLNSPTIERALRTHAVQNKIHGYVHHIAKNEVVGNLIEAESKGMPKGAWSKPALLLSVIVAEMAKPEKERLEWVFWFDADTIILNPLTPLEVFLPLDDDPTMAEVHMLIASNWDGLNSGVMAFRVHPWSVSVLSIINGYPIFLQERLKTDKFRDQSAIQWLLQNDTSPLGNTPEQGRHNWATVPMRWFNSLPVNNAFRKNGTWLFGADMTEEMFDQGTDKVYDDGHSHHINPWKVMRGDMVVHFAGSTRVRDSWMGPWLDRTEQYLPEWNDPNTQYTLAKEVAKFYKNLPNQWKEEKKAAEKKKEDDKKKAEQKAKDEKKKNEEEEKKKKEEEAKKKEEEDRKKKEEEDRKKKEEEDKKRMEEEKASPTSSATVAGEESASTPTTIPDIPPP
ncbi:galactosyl transferase gma12 mnn10 family protein [Xylogone sp. PMI_703]|nr:galactosyl transferase gma12 mnn10 family protein [Xylogone sp. PMI_703]